MKIYHVADLHLGRTRLEGRLPTSDLADAFAFTAKAAIQDHADVFLIAGDLFDKPQVEPAHLRSAENTLRLLKDASIPVIAIEGNHDRFFVHQEHETWTAHLGVQGLLILLKPSFSVDGVDLQEWNPETLSGSTYRLKHVRFTGAGYLGAATPARCRLISEALPPSETREVLLLHAGPDYFVGEGGGFAGVDLHFLREKFDYLALGHIHKPMIHDGWACNPGSPENCSLAESRYGETTGRGCAIVQLPESGPVSIQLLDVPRRPVHFYNLDVTRFKNKRIDGNEAILEAAVNLVQPDSPAPSSVLNLRLTGQLNLNLTVPDRTKMAEDLARTLGIQAAEIDLNSLNLPGAEGGATRDDNSPVWDRFELERQAVEQVVAEDFSALPIDNFTEQAEFYLALKSMVDQDQGEEAIFEKIRHAQLTRQVADRHADMNSTL